jgi:hypothetical protein
MGSASCQRDFRADPDLGDAEHRFKEGRVWRFCHKTEVRPMGVRVSGRQRNRRPWTGERTGSRATIRQAPENRVNEVATGPPQKEL